MSRTGYYGVFLLLFAFLSPASGQNKATLQFSLNLDVKIYDYSDYGEPPQIAIWLEHKITGRVRTVFVTRRTAQNEWKGKIHCPVSLPYWQSRNKNTLLPDGVSGATPKNRLTCTIDVTKGSEWNYFIEVNISGDYNAAFPAMTDSGTPDSQGNGQPSLIYKGMITALPGQMDSPRLTGRTMQMLAADRINMDLLGITNARQVLSSISVKVVE